VRVAVEERHAAVDRTASGRVAHEQPAEPAFELPRDLVERHVMAGSRRAFDGEVVAQVVVELLQRFDDQEVDRKPDRPSPVRVAAEHGRPRLAGLVVDAVNAVADEQLVGRGPVPARHGAHAVRRQELGFVQHEVQHAAQLVG
jgi:hypothetical protein